MESSPSAPTTEVRPPTPVVGETGPPPGLREAAYTINTVGAPTAPAATEAPRAETPAASPAAPAAESAEATTNPLLLRVARHIGGAARKGYQGAMTRLTIAQS